MFCVYAVNETIFSKTNILPLCENYLPLFQKKSKIFAQKLIKIKAESIFIQLRRFTLLTDDNLNY